MGEADADLGDKISTLETTTAGAADDFKTRIAALEEDSTKAQDTQAKLLKDETSDIEDIQTTFTG
jgi:hypothetical protein